MSELPWFLATIGVVSGLYWWIEWKKQYATTDKIIGYWKESIDFNRTHAQDCFQLIHDFSDAVSKADKTIELTEVLSDIMRLHKMEWYGEDEYGGRFVARRTTDCETMADADKYPALAKYLKEKADEPK